MQWDTLVIVGDTKKKQKRRQRLKNHLDRLDVYRSTTKTKIKYAVNLVAIILPEWKDCVLFFIRKLRIKKKSINNNLIGGKEAVSVFDEGDVISQSKTN